MLEADYVIIGSGSAGSALAYRLSEDGKHSVIVIEYGGTDFGPLIQMPSALSIPMNMATTTGAFPASPSRIWAAAFLPPRAARCSAARRRSTAWSMCAATPATSTIGPKQGATGWAYADVLPYFKRMEHSHGGEDGLARHRRSAACAARPAHAIRSTPPSSRPAARPASS